MLDKLATTSTGIDVTGTATMDGLTVQTTNGLNALLESSNSYQYLQFKNTDETNNYIGFVSDDFVVSPANNQKLIVTAEGNVGIGVVPKTWYSASTALEIGSMSLEDYGVSGANVSVFANNLYRNTSNAYVYKESDFAASYSQYNGEHTFNTAPSGTADSAATLTAVMKIDSSGNVGVGTASPTLASAWNKVLHVQSAGAGSSIRLADSASGTSGEVGLLMGQYSNSSYIINRDSSNMYFWTGGQERVRLDSAGNLLVGRSSDSGLGKLQVYGGADIAGGDVYLARDTGNVLVGKTATSQTTAGTVLYSNGQVYSTASGTQASVLTRLSSDGPIQIFYKDSSEVASIGTLSGTMYIGNGDCNLLLTGATDQMLPVGTNGATKSGQIDLGSVRRPIQRPLPIRRSASQLHLQGRRKWRRSAFYY